ncbi:hypothetical protein KAFR_0D01710 [Kazachstania africana CBS 2517]|uniref:Cytochrome b mRNA-processing protein 4 n=1 Tax=Kazachstania africana (strain ATCC 22294 / BCRC 22015 / CBS 2517 / CECT 1963 / NBRC 1671 / NRRL Y-8276) TaxID=1071382 RepID=H2ATW8_KAZAF|nr:hypothetical protein KAFR_0D01710 [Kazachstania africana CBS 2517]CCF57818.1 hypothetical protein KAFR_0D01710 [Kazachstania africana CBS 2517]
MERPLWVRWLKVYAYGGAIILGGVLLFKYTTPTDEELINSFSPEVRAQYEKDKEIRRQEQAELMNIVKKTASSNDPIWKTGPLRTPWESDSKNQDPFDQFQKLKAEKKQKAELLRVQEELQKIQQQKRAQQKQQGSNSWWGS